MERRKKSTDSKKKEWELKMIALLRVILGVSMENMQNENKFIDFSLLLPETGVNREVQIRAKCCETKGATRK